MTHRPAEAAAGSERSTAEPSEAGAHLDLAALFARYSAYVAAIGLRLLGRDDEVDDLVQDVFLAAERGLSQVREEGAVKGWLATIAVRQATRRLRLRRVRRWVGLDEVPTYEALPAGGASPETRLLVVRVYAALDELPPRLRVPWTLRYLEGEQLAAIATHCGCSLATVKRRIADAHRRVRGKLA